MKHRLLLPVLLTTTALGLAMGIDDWSINAYHSASNNVTKMGKMPALETLVKALRNPKQLKL